MKHRKDEDIFIIELQTFVSGKKTAYETEQISVKSDGTVIHQKHGGDRLRFSRSVPVDDLLLVERLFDDLRNVWKPREWQYKYYTMRFRPMRQIHRIIGPSYRRWIIEYTEEGRLRRVYGDVPPMYAGEISGRVLALCAFDPVPDLFFMKSGCN